VNGIRRSRRDRVGRAAESDPKIKIEIANASALQASERVVSGALVESVGANCASQSEVRFAAEVFNQVTAVSRNCHLLRAMKRRVQRIPPVMDFVAHFPREIALLEKAL
jgi:hypothetical protein